MNVRIHQMHVATASILRPVNIHKTSAMHHDKTANTSIDVHELVRTFGLQGRVALITGAGSGLGRQAAITLARAGAAVALVGRRTEVLLETAALLPAGAVSLVLPVDIGDAAAFGAALERVEAELGDIWVLVNSAGVGGRKPMLEVDEAQYTGIFAVNTRGAFFAAQAVARRMVARKSGGRIINICSLAAETHSHGLGVYGASKAALEHLSRSMAYEWAPHGINVNVLNPGYILTDINRAMFQSEPGRAMVATLPRQRLGEPSDLDGAILLLASPTSRFITGASLSVHDGQKFSAR